jgi:Mg/Co/Ni transporter MgtE
MSASLALVERYVASQPQAVAREIDRLAPGDAAQVVSAISAECAAALLPHLATVQAAQAMAELPPAEAAAVLQHLAMDPLTSVLRRLAPDTAARVLDDLPPARANAARALLAHAPDTAGAVMDPEVLTVPADASVDDARALLARYPAHAYYYVYALDADHRLAGVCDLAELMQARAGPLRTILRTDLITLPAASPLGAVFVHPGWRQLDALPVIGDGRRFLGVLRHRRMRQLLEREPPVPADDRTVRTMMALGEIYWLGLCGLLQGIAATATEPPAGRSPS